MSVLAYRNGDLFLEDVSLRQIAVHYGTPAYVYSQKAIVDAYLDYAHSLGDHPGMICYAVKANSNLAVLSLLARLGAGFDIVSAGELERVIAAGGKASRVVFSGVGKQAWEMARALELGVACFNVESEGELELLAEVAKTQQKTARISVRVNPDVDAKTHPYISTGLKENKFGIDIARAPEVYSLAAQLPYIQVVGVDCHIGSQLTDTAPFVDALDRVLALVDELAERQIAIEHLDLGGGLGVTYRDEQPPRVQDYLAAIKQKLQGRNLALMLEPGRSIVANAGVLLTQVLYLKTSEHKNFAIIDAAMNDNIRPALYQAWQDIVPLHLREEPTKAWDLVGPVCETGDFLGKARELALHSGDLLAVKSAGAYGFTMSSNYNTRPRAVELLVSGDRVHIARERETVAQLLTGENPLQQDWD